MINEYLLPIILTLSVIDLILTNYYISKYKKWQPNKPLGLIEMNPLLVLLMTYLGINAGMFFGGFIIIGLIIIIGNSLHIYILSVLGLLLCLAIFNHVKNLKLLNKLIEKYPTGYLPKEIFGEVEGNNLNKTGGKK